jgi:hypothetical protein
MSPFLRSARRRFVVSCAVLLAAVAVAPADLAAQLKRAMPESLTDAEFWEFFTSMSEEGGSFLSENFVSNEQTFQHVIPTLQRSVTPGGVYLGVGPEQNFTYITNLKPRMAVIFDIRRQNAMQHLMYKALFEMSPTRADFISRLFSRPLSSSVGPTSTPEALFRAVESTSANDSAFAENMRAIFKRLVNTHRFAITSTDSQTIAHVYSVFFEAGPNINYSFRPNSFIAVRPAYATFGQLQNLTNAEGVNMAFLGTEENYQWLRALQLKNLVVPVVGNFAGPKAIRAVGEYLTQRRATVGAFYLSNVEQYLFRQPGDAESFYKNVQSLPIDSTSTFIRSVPPGGFGFGGGGSSMISFNSSVNGVANYYSVQVMDSAGLKIITSTTDSAGMRTTRRTVDSTGRNISPLEIFRRMTARDDSVRRSLLRDTTSTVTVVAPRAALPSTSAGTSLVMGGGTLASGIASIKATLDAFAVGRLYGYNDVIAMTKISGWTAK